MKQEDLYFYDIQVATRYQGKPVSVHHLATLFHSTEIFRAASEDRLSRYAPPLSEAQIAVVFGYAADLAGIAANLAGSDPAWLDIASRLAEAGEPIWNRHPSERRAPPTWRPNVSE